MKMKNSNLGLNYKKSKYLANVQEQWVSLWHKPVSILPEVALAFFFFFLEPGFMWFQDFETV